MVGRVTALMFLVFEYFLQVLLGEKPEIVQQIVFFSHRDHFLSCFIFAIEK